MSLYDSWYLRAVHPIEQLGIWIRHTYQEDKDGRVRGARWLTLFAPDSVQARKAFLDGKPAAGPDRFAGEAGDAHWDVRVRGLSPTFEHFPARWMYRTRFPKTKPVSVYPLARMDGEVSIAGRKISIDGWPGMVGHNWGAEHAHSWIWLHVAGFDDEPDGWLDFTLARLKIGPIVTPWLANGAICLGGERHRVGGPFRSPSVTASAGKAEIALSGKGLRLIASVDSPTDATVVWKYGDPDGGEHFAANCSIARLGLKVSQDGRVREKFSSHKAAYELGMREAPAGYPVQPFPDP